jgi:hypothetical protein
MSKRNKVLILIGVILIVFFSSFYYFKYSSTSKTFVKNINKVWNVKLPKPEKEITIMQRQPSFHGEGEDFVILEYKDEDIEKVKDVLALEEKSLNLDVHIKLLIEELWTKNIANKDLSKEIRYNAPDINKVYFGRYISLKEDTEKVVFILQGNKVYVIQIFM